MQKLTDRVLKIVLGVAVFVAMSGTAYAGPPLICHPFDAGKAALLPWGAGPGWNSPDRSYDVQKLTADTLRLLTPTAPVLARMENMRRATIYAAQDRNVAAALLKAVVDRARPSGAGTIEPMASFDAGYLIETYKQYESTAPLASGTDGYSLVKKALLHTGQNAEMEFAASLMQRGTVAAEHRRRAVEGAAKGSLLAKNLASIGQ